VSRDRNGARGKSMAAYLARKISGYRVKEIADHFNRNPVTVGEAITKVEDLLRRDRSFEKVVKLLEGNVIKGRKREYRISVACPQNK